MQLNDLKTHPVIKYAAYFGFTLIIISFVFFYGWSSSSLQSAATSQAYARYRSTETMSFLPWRKWDLILTGEVREAAGVVADRKLALLGPQLASQLTLLGIRPESLATDEEAVQQAVDDRMLLREAKRLDMYVSLKEIMEHIRLAHSEANVNQVLISRGWTFEQFTRAERDTRSTARVRNFIGNDARTSLYELWLEYKLLNESIMLSVATYPASDFLDQVQLSEENVQAYFEEHAEEYRIPAKRRYQYVTLTREEMRESVEPTTEQLQTYYEQNQVDFQRDEAVLLEDIVVLQAADQPTTQGQLLIALIDNELTTETSFSEVVDRYSEEYPDVRLRYRDVGWVERDDLSVSIHGRDYINRVFTLADDAISSSVQTPFGLHIVRRLQYRESGVLPLEEVADEVETRYREEKSGELFDERVESLGKEIERFDNLRDFAIAMDLEDGITSLVLATDSFLPEIGSLAQHANYIRSLRENRLSELIPLTDMVCALEVVEHQDSRIPPLDDVREDVEFRLKRAGSIDLALAAAQSALDEIRGGEEFETVINDALTTPVLTTPFKRTDLEQLIPLTGLNFPLIGFTQQTLRIGEGSTGVSAYGFSQDLPVGYSLWKVMSIEPPTKAQFALERRAFEADYLQLKQLTMVEEWLADKRKQAEFELLGNFAQ